MKDFDAPDLANYIDPDTIDKIQAAKAKPKPKRKRDSPDGKEVHDARIKKMKELYGMFVKMDTEA